MWGREQPGVLVLQITLLVLIRKFHIDCLKDTFLEKAEIAIKSWFAVVGANNSILDLLFLFYLMRHTGSQRTESWEPLGILAQFPWCIKGETEAQRGERSSI